MRKLLTLTLLLFLVLPLAAQQGMGPGPGVKSYSAAVTTFVNDTFTDTNGTLLHSHTGETGATWTKHPSFTSDFTIQTNRAQKDAATASAVYTASGVAGTINYTVEVVLIDITAENRSAGGCGWVDTAADDAICIRRLNSTTVELIKIGGTGTAQIDSAPVTFSASTSHTLKVVRSSGDSFEWFLDGVSQGVHTISDSAFQAASLPNGVGWVTVRASNSHVSVGYHIDRITAWH